jgi:hypothetical protein
MAAIEDLAELAWLRQLVPGFKLTAGRRGLGGAA